MPPILASDVFSDFLSYENGAIISTTISSTLAINFVVSLLIGASLKFIWGLINSIQIIVYMGLFSVNSPGNLKVFLQVLMHTVSINLKEFIE